MNFFEHQDRARRITALLLFFYALAVIGTIAGVYLATRFFYLVFVAQQTRQTIPAGSNV
jgi:hypothetical protein